MDAATYASLSLINQAFQQIEQHIQYLKDSAIIPDRSSEGWQIRTAELRAEINHALTSILREKEEQEWARFGRLRTTMEERLESSK